LTLSPLLPTSPHSIMKSQHLPRIQNRRLSSLTPSVSWRPQPPFSSLRSWCAPRTPPKPPSCRNTIPGPMSCPSTTAWWSPGQPTDGRVQQFRFVGDTNGALWENPALYGRTPATVSAITTSEATKRGRRPNPPGLAAAQGFDGRTNTVSFTNGAVTLVTSWIQVQDPSHQKHRTAPQPTGHEDHHHLRTHRGNQPDQQ